MSRAPASTPERPVVAYVTAVYPALSETFVAREIEGLRARGWQIRTAALRRPSPEQAPQGSSPSQLDHLLTSGGALRTLTDALVEMLRHPLRSARTLSAATRDALHPAEPMPLRRRINVLALALIALGFARSARREGIGHIHAHFANGPSTVALYAAAQLGIPFSFTGHANDIFDRRSLLVRKLERARFVACISEWHRDWYRSQAGPSDRYALIRCGVEVDEESSAQPDAHGSDSPRRILCVARMIEKKGIDTLIRAVACLDRERPGHWRLELIGDGPLRDDLEQLARDLDIAHHVEFLGQRPNAEVREHLTQADYFALACRTDRLGDKDGIPVVLMEAMSAGAVVFAGDLPAIRELVRDDETGIIVPPDGVDELAQALAAIDDNPERRAALAKAAHEHVRTEFSISVNLDRLESELLAHQTSDLHSDHGRQGKAQ